MREMIQAHASRLLTVEGVGRFSVPPPSVRDALTVIAVAHHGADVPPEDWQHLKQETARWLPMTTHTTLWAERYFSDTNRLRALIKLIRSFTPPSLEPGDDEEETGGSSANAFEDRSQRWWWQQIVRYRARLGCSLDAVLSESWPAFLAQRREMPMLEARDSFRIAQGSVAADPRAGDSSLFNSIAQAARFDGEESEDDTEADHGLSDEERDEILGPDDLDEKLAEAEAIRHRIN